MVLDLRDILCCPVCHSPLVSKDGFLACGCNHYPIINGIPRFVPGDSYARSFSLEWAKHSKTMLDSVSGSSEAEKTFFERTGLSPDDIKGKLVLDAGCGAGRHMEVVKKYGGNIIGVDMSYSVEQAYENAGDYVFQADIMDLPFRDESFDVVFSWGVIHSTSDTHLAFRKLSKLVKPGGKLAIWVYSNEGLLKIHNMVSDIYRVVATRMPQGLLYKLCYISVPLYYFHCLPVIGWLGRLLLPISLEKSAEDRVLNTYDWYSPIYQTKHTYKQIEKWFVECGYKDVRHLPVPVSVQGTKN